MQRQIASDQQGSSKMPGSKFSSKILIIFLKGEMDFFVMVHDLVVLTASNQRAETEMLLKFRAIPMTN